MRSISTDCLFKHSLNLLDSNVAERVTDPQDIVSLGAYELSELIVESTLTISSLKRSDNGSYTCNITNMLPETSTISVVTDFTVVIVLGKYIYVYLFKYMDTDKGSATTDQIFIESQCLPKLGNFVCYH